MDRTDHGRGTAKTRVFPARDGADPGRTGYDVSAMIEDTSPTVIGTIIVRARGLGRLANALGHGPPDDGGGGPHSPVALLLRGATAGAADCP